MNKSLASWIGKAAYQATQFGGLSGKDAHAKADAMASGYLDYGIDLARIDPVLTMRRSLGLTDAEVPYKRILGADDIQIVTLHVRADVPDLFIELCWMKGMKKEPVHVTRPISAPFVEMLNNALKSEPQVTKDGISIANVDEYAVVSFPVSQECGAFSFALTEHQIKLFVHHITGSINTRELTSVAIIGAVLDESLLAKQPEKVDPWMAQDLELDDETPHSATA